MRYLKTEGIIINRLVLRDADKMLTLFTRDRGKIVCYARGVRNITSSRATKLDLFSKIACDMVEKNDHKTLTHVTLLESYRSSKKNLGDISRLFQIGELIDGLLPENQRNEEVYDLLETALANLRRFETTEYLRRFKVRVLEYLGYGSRDLGIQALDNYIESILERPLVTKNIL